MNAAFIRFATVIISFALLASSLAGCSSTRRSGSQRFDNSFSATAAKQFKPLKTNVVAVLPLEGGAAKQLPEELSRRLTSQLVRALEIDSSLEILNSSDEDRVHAAAQQVAALQSPIQTKAVRFAEALAVQGVLFGVIGKYSADQEGTRLGSFNPAGAGFKLWLVDAASGDLLWSATYDKQQQPLTENLLNVGDALKQGVGFVSSEQLMERGFHQAALSLERLREAARAEAEAGGK